MLTRRHLLLTAAALTFAARGASSEDATLPVVATFTILADFVRQVGGARVSVVCLVGPDADAHAYQPRPSDAKALASAKLVVTNGLGLEGFMARLLKSSGTKAAIVEAAKGITPRKGDEDDGHAFDPHAWQSIANAKVYVTNIRDALIAADPAGIEAYQANSAAYLMQLDAVEAEIIAAIAKIPAADRRLVSSHDAFGYFADAYGLAFIPAQGLSTEAEPTAQRIAKLIRQVKQERVKAVFLEKISNPRLANRIAEETGARIGGTLYSDALSDAKGPAPTYIDMVRHNLRMLSSALTTS